MSHARPDLTFLEDFLETVFVEITVNSSSFVVGQVYRRPKTDIKCFLEKLKSIIDMIHSEKKTCILLGDININLLKPIPDTQDLTSLLYSKFYFNAITKPTRVTHKTATLIDHIWTNDLKNLNMSGIIYMSLSDHFPVFSKFNLPTATKTDKVKTVHYRDFNDNNIMNFKDHLENIDWQLVLTARNPNVAYDYFSTIFNAGFNTFFPIENKKHQNKVFR